MIEEKIMKKFNDDNFQLFNEAARKLYFDYARQMPIIDYHCHLNPKEIYDDSKFKDLSDVWLKGDHYKWRSMRARGIDEKYITGSGSNEEKFQAWAETIPYLIGNPLYHWTHMELKAFFGIDEILSPKTASSIYEKANQVLKTLTARKMIEMSNVEVLCTTDDPVDSLEYHLKLREERDFQVKVYPAFRPDKALNIELSWFQSWLNQLSQVVGYQINELDDLLKALTERINFFDKVGCRVSDHALDEVLYLEASKEEADEIFKKSLASEKLSNEELSKYKGYLLKFLGRQYLKKDWVQQYHIGALRDVNTNMLSFLGPNTGYDSINDSVFILNLAKLLDSLAKDNSLPKTIIYTLNPAADDLVAALVHFRKKFPGKFNLVLPGGLMTIVTE
jgi:glucuronate isomerase